MILAVMNTIYTIAYVKAWKSQDFNGVWTRDHEVIILYFIIIIIIIIIN